MDFAQKPFASVAALLLLGLFTACSPAAEEPAALAQPSRGAHREAATLEAFLKGFEVPGYTWQLETNPPFDPGVHGFVSCWVLKVDTLETRYVYEFTDSSAYNGFDNGYVYDRMAEMTGCTNPGSNCADACCGRFHAKFYSTVR